MLNKLTVVARKIGGKPNDIPNSQWLVKDKEYTLIKLCRSKFTGDLYYKLAEIQPPPPYGGYRADRFELIFPESKEDYVEIELEVEEIL